MTETQVNQIFVFISYIFQEPINQQDLEKLVFLKWLKFSHCFPRQLKKEREDQRRLEKVWDDVSQHCPAIYIYLN